MPPEAQAPSTDKDQWLLALENIAERLGKEGPPVRLCLIGSAACIFAGMELRTTEGLDVWKPSSDFDLSELKAACEATGISFNPKGMLEPDRPYLQLVEAGIVQVGNFEPTHLFRISRLIISRPPIENIIASKLIRADAKDIEEIQFLYHHFQPDPTLIRAVIASFPETKRELASENLVYLEILG
jgi:hypothetical protein